MKNVQKMWKSLVLIALIYKEIQSERNDIISQMLLLIFFFLLYWLREYTHFYIKNSKFTFKPAQVQTVQKTQAHTHWVS